MLGQNTTFSLTSSNITLFVVGMLESSGSTTSQVYFIDGGGVNTGRFYNWVDYSSGLDNVNIYHGDTQTTVFYPIPNRRIFNPFILSQSTGTSPQTGSINGITFNASSGNIGSMTVTGLTIGGPWNNVSGALPYTWPGHICEVILYNTALTSNQREQVEGYLAQKWGLVSQMPESHISKRAVIYPSVRKPNTLIPYYTQFSPKSIPGCILWLDGLDTSTMTFSGSNVTQWRDKSVRGFNVATSSGATAPVYNSTTKELQFVSGNSNSFTIPQGFGDALVGTTFSFFFIAKRTVFTTYAYLLSGATSGGNQNLFIGFLSNKMEIGEYGPYASADIPAFNSPDPRRLYYYDIQSSTSANLIMNGTSLSTTVAGNLFLTSFTQPEIGRRYGGAVYHDFNLSEMMVFSPAITTTQRQQVESYLAQKWNLSASLPSDHINGRFPVGVPSGLVNILPEISRGVKSKPPLPMQIQTFTYTGALQSFVVPATTTSIRVYIWGAAGGGDIIPAGIGGAGAMVQGVLSVSGGQTLSILVGGGGQSTGAGGFGGGGNAANEYAGGGGRSSITISGTEVVIAGAGGGGVQTVGGGIGTFSGNGGDGSGWDGTSSMGGKGGNANGTGGAGGIGSAYNGVAGNGRLGGVGTDYSSGGGAGYGGGGSSGVSTIVGASGGGGSSLTSNLTVIPGESVLGYNSTNGYSAPNSSSPYYQAGVAAGVTAGNGGNGLVVLVYAA